MISIQYVTLEDKGFWFSLDAHLPENEFDRKVRDHQGYVLFEDGIPKGILRYNLFWDEIPFCTLLFIYSAFQRRGLGRLLMEFWENDMKSQGYRMLMTSTRADENAQHFYRELGYKDCGGFILDIPGFEQPMEIVLTKAL